MYHNICIIIFFFEIYDDELPCLNARVDLNQSKLAVRSTGKIAVCQEEAKAALRRFPNMGVALDPDGPSHVMAYLQLRSGLGRISPDKILNYISNAVDKMDHGAGWSEGVGVRRCEVRVREGLGGKGREREDAGMDRTGRGTERMKWKTRRGMRRVSGRSGMRERGVGGRNGGWEEGEHGRG